MDLWAGNEAAWGPYGPETTHLLSRMFGPKGDPFPSQQRNAGASEKSDHCDSHTKTETIRIPQADYPIPKMSLLKPNEGLIILRT